MTLNEFDIIATYFQRSSQHPSVVKSVGDDCAIVSPVMDQLLVMSMDTVVAGRHFPEAATPAQIASRAFCTAISDLAAMGAKPQWFTMALVLPNVDAQWLHEFSESLFAMANQYECDLIGGDTTQGPLAVTIQVHGTVPKNKVLTRDAAQVGDSVFVSGPIGDGAAALLLLLNSLELEEDDQAYLLNRFYQPRAQIETGIAILPYAHAAIDISDGLVADLQHIANASQVDIDVDVERVPLSMAYQHVFAQYENKMQPALTGGDDYQLAFTVPENQIAHIQALIKKNKIAATKIGQVVQKRLEKPYVHCYHNQQSFLLTGKQGYQHFAS